MAKNGEMTKAEMMKRTKEVASDKLGMDGYGDCRIDSFTWIIETEFGQAKVSITACKDPINLDDAIAELGLKEEERARKEAEREAKKLAKEVK